jgi:hypothetical protein
MPDSRPSNSQPNPERSKPLMPSHATSPVVARNAALSCGAVEQSQPAGHLVIFPLLACAIPALTRSRRMSRSNSRIRPACRRARPLGVSRRESHSTKQSRLSGPTTSCSVFTRSTKDRSQRSSRHTTTRSISRSSYSYPLPICRNHQTDCCSAQNQPSTLKLVFIARPD